MSSSAGPDIITNGLVLHLDAADRKSYPGSGTVWTDRSENLQIGQLINNPIYRSSNGGFFEFGGASQHVIVPNSTILDTQTPSVEVWIKTNATSQNGFWFEKGFVNTQYSLFQEGNTIQWRTALSSGGYTNLTTASTYINTSNWYQIVGTYTSGSRRLYINGILINLDTQAGTIATSVGGMSIGVYGGYSGSRGYYYNGNLSICRVYNKVLTPQEVLQNFNATKSRFGLL